MGRPHPTVDIPGVHPGVLAETESCDLDPDGFAAQLRRGLSRDDADVIAGHVCATAWIFDPEGTRLLLVRHRRLGWASPGGHVHPDETVTEAIWREVAEETGLGPPELRLWRPGPFGVHVTDTAETDHRHWNLAFLFTASPDVALRREEGEGPGGELAWFDVEDVMALAGVDGPDDLATMTPRAVHAFRASSTPPG